VSPTPSSVQVPTPFSVLRTCTFAKNSNTEWQRQRRGSNMWKFNLIQFNSKLNEINLFSFF
jgi:hypothetical protein